MPFFEYLGGLDRPERLELPVPHLTAEADAAGNDVDVIVVGILVPDRNPLRVRWEPHFPHEIGGNVLPFLTVQPVASGQSQRAMPHRAADFLAQSPCMTELGSQCAGVG